MFIYTTWICPHCNKENDFEDNVKEQYVSTSEICDYCNKEVFLTGSIKLEFGTDATY